MPKNTHYIVAIILIVLFVNVGSVYFGQKHAREEKEAALNQAVSSSTEQNTSVPAATSSQPTATSEKPTAALSSGNVAGFYSYANSQHGFSIQYPPYAKQQSSFATFHEVGNNWRLYAGQANQGKGVVSFSIRNIDQGIYFTGKQTYPLYYMAEVRVGISPNTKECYTPDAGYPNQKITNTTINGYAFKKFSTTEAAAPKYTQSESYRAIHNNACYVIEQIQSGTKLRDDKMTVAVTDAQLTASYNLGEKIVKTFKFTK
jgi:predicted lipoprotein with Yx(FWY)xxD motif